MTYFQKKSWTTAKKQGGYDSRFEAGFAQELELRKKAKDIKDFEAHVRIPLEVNGYVVCDYYVDFKIYHNDGSIEYAETKGFSTPAFKLKWKLFEALYGDQDGVKLTLIFQGKSWKPRFRKT